MTTKDYLKQAKGLKGYRKEEITCSSLEELEKMITTAEEAHKILFFIDGVGPPKWITISRTSIEQGWRISDTDELRLKGVKYIHEVLEEVNIIVHEALFSGEKYIPHDECFFND